MERSKVKVLIVDDSAYMRKFLGDIVNSSDGLKLVATARDGEDALLKIKQYRPDVVTLDVEMLRLNGVETLKRIMEKTPLPVIMVSSFTRRGSEITVEALALGAVDFVAKPSQFTDSFARELKIELPLKIKHAAAARLDPGRHSGIVVEKHGFLPRQGGFSFPGHYHFYGCGLRPRALEKTQGPSSGLPAAVFTQHIPPNLPFPGEKAG